MSGPGAAAVSPEELLAFVDGELPEPGSGAVAAALAADPAARAMAAALRRGGSAAARAYDAILAEPVPARLLAVLAEPATATGRVLPFRPRRRSAALAALATAACLALLLLGLAGGYSLRSLQPALRLASDGSDPAAARFAAALYEALDRGTIGASVDYTVPATGTAGRVTITAALATRGGMSCREFRHEIRGADGTRAEAGIACRSPDDGWQTLTLPAP
jgi:anti-sigma factor RsiW